MSSSLRRGALAASAIVFSIASLAACGAGNDAQTLEIKPDNAATSVGNIKVQNALLITQPDAKAPGPVAIAATLFNTGNTDQTLQSISVPGAGNAQLKPAKGQSLTVPSHGSLVIGGKDNASALVTNGSEAIKNGNAQKVTFTLSETGAVSLPAFVVPATSYFSTWGPSEIPAAPTAPATPATGTATATAGATSSASGTPAAGDKASPSATATGTTPSDSASQSAAGN
ncbi:DUF461 domain-containing protein [Streptomyces sp. NPDC048297]|uniref:DUF461 domain-containing protein n=1 Tax=Streptomyces sp. NPDC048297 TaxID=3365531 RepID=UPI00371F190E